MKFRSGFCLSSVAAVVLAFSTTCHAVPWFPFGPDGGDARSFAGDPRNHEHIYLGTANGWVYESRDGGRRWSRLARVGQRDDFVLDSIEVNKTNPNQILVGAHATDRPDGGVYLSTDAGKTWVAVPDMIGHSIRAMASAPSNPSIVVAGALDGVYRSEDAGLHWQLISPAGSTEIHEIESLAVDPKDPKTIYAGTWHLPWKTTDGGGHWNNIKEGIIEDSDVFSIIVDPKSPNTVYASACSGIYKSENAGTRFTKVQGIPSTARRTRVLMQDPRRADIVFAGTTEGLFRTSDAGKTWMRNTGTDVIINDVFVDPENTDHVLLATDRGGVMSSQDGGFSFLPSNSGFSARQISSFAASQRMPAHVAVGVVNDKTYGGVFMSNDGGMTWAQRSLGLDGRDVFSLLRTADDTLLAGTSHGIFRWVDDHWVQSGLLLGPVKTSRNARGRYVSSAAPSQPFDGAVNALAASGNTVYAAAGDNVVVSLTAGEGWQTVPALAGKEWRYIAVQDGHVVVGGLHAIELSTDLGKTWKPVALPSDLPTLRALSIDATGRIWAGGREGLSYSTDHGASWNKVPNLYIADVNNIYYDNASRRVLVTVNRPTLAYAISTTDLKISYLETGWNLRFMRPVGDHMLGATLFDGVVIQPRMVNSAVAENNTK